MRKAALLIAGIILLTGCIERHHQQTATQPATERRYIDHRQELDNILEAMLDEDDEHIGYLKTVLSELRDVEKRYPKDERIKEIADELEVLIEESSMKGEIDDIKAELIALDWE